MTTYFTSESVTEGHPDKICDQIADGILDALLDRDPSSRVACEVTASIDGVHIMGEITSSATIDYDGIARTIIRNIGYTDGESGFSADTVPIRCSIHEQSPDIAMGVDCSWEQRKKHGGGDLEMGAGDQGMMFGFACEETPELMPLPIMLAHALVGQLSHVRKTGLVPFLRPDGKAQVTVEYRDGIPRRASTIVVSAQHAPDVDMDTLRETILKQVVSTAIPGEYIDDDTTVYINPTGRFVVGGPRGDSGLTGRKIMVDTYGGYARHGGGSFSGKDPSKVDRSAAYMARYIAKDIVASHMASRCEIQLSYAIGVASPVSVAVDTAGTGSMSDEELASWIAMLYDARPAAIIERFDLKRPIYLPTAVYGHFGREGIGFPWERIV